MLLSQGNTGHQIRISPADPGAPKSAAVTLFLPVSYDGMCVGASCTCHICGGQW